jgi:uncharacterized protein with LGFP repeats
VSHSAPCLSKWTPIQQRYTQLGSQGSVLGATVTAEHKGGHGHVQHYQGGRMYWSNATGAHYLTGNVLHRYIQLGEMASPLGLPTADIGSTVDDTGQQARFQNGGIYQHRGHGAHGLWGDVWAKWHGLGSTAGALGYPTTDLTRSPRGGGHFVHFTDGAIYQRGGQPPHDLVGDIAVKYRQIGAEQGLLGYPADDQRPAVNGKGVTGFEVVCEHGAVAMAEGHHAYAVSGPIYITWHDQGGAAGELGFPFSDVFEVNLVDGPGQRCDFEYGSATYDDTTKQVTVVPS